MLCTVGKTFKFDAAHTLMGHSGPCGRLHGHLWTVKVEVEGTVDTETWMVMDFGDLSRVVRAHLDLLDHRELNAALETGRPTAEFLAHWLLMRCRPSLSALKHLDMVRVSVQESDGGWAVAEETLNA